MALGAGTWITQNKVLPGSYINVTSMSKASATLSERGLAAVPFELSWGPENQVFEVTASDFQKHSKSIFGYAYNHDKLLPLREVFQNATKVFCYRLGAGATAAANTLATAKYPGVRGNDISITVSPNVDDETRWDVGTYLDGICMDSQTVATAAALVDNDFATFKPAATLAATAGMPLTGGADAASITGDSHQSFLEKIEAYAFHTLCCPSEEGTIVGLYTAYTKRMREEVGAKFQLVAWRPVGADYEGVIGVRNAATHGSIDGVAASSLVYWVAGAQAGVPVSRSLTNAVYSGELLVDTDVTQAALISGIQAGEFLFHNNNGSVCVLEDLNTLVTLSDTKGDLFQSNQTMRVCDQIANDIAVMFNTRYVGRVPNDASGRASLWGDVIKLISSLEQLRAVENFDEDTVAVSQGDNKNAVLLTMDGLSIVNAMSKLYMSVVIQ